MDGHPHHPEDSRARAANVVVTTVTSNASSKTNAWEITSADFFFLGISIMMIDDYHDDYHDDDDTGQTGSGDAREPASTKG